ncbi:MAG: hypothetical protein ACFB4J_14355 [Elainellaceae cyanobacterium]
MIWLQNLTHCGVVRLENLPRLERISLLKDILTNHGQDLLAGAIVIATQQKIRVRRKMSSEL